ncbi:MAG: hypothetical protein ACKO9F_19025, partial [Caldilinea sp.]
LYFFWGEGCPHCAAAKPFLVELEQRYPSLTVRAYEVWNHEANRALFVQIAARHGVEPTAVPVFFVGNRHWIGYAEAISALEIERAVGECVRAACPDADSGGVASAEFSPARRDPSASSPPAAGRLTVPWLGSVDLGAQSLLLSTALIAFVDGINPCSLWVLSMLLALTLHTGSRRRVLGVGLVFLSTTSLVYMLFIVGLFNLFALLEWIPWIQGLVASVALLLAVVNLKEYFLYGKGFSLTIASRQKPGLYCKLRRVLAAGSSLPALVGATIVLSAGASLVEFSCTAGFPLLWTNLLATQGVTPTTFWPLLALYMVIYQLDELAIFVGTLAGLRASRLSETQGRILKLAGGMWMLILATVMLVDPTWMNSLAATLWIFALAIAGTLLTLWVHRWLLPAAGLYIGSEELPGRSARRKKS